MFNGKWVKKDTSLDLRYSCSVDSLSYILFQVWDDSLSYRFAEIPDSNLSQVNHSLGQWLRNDIGLWGRNCIVEYFWKFNTMHPDDMSAIILTNYHRQLNGMAANTEDQVMMFKSFWKNEFGLEYELKDSFNWEFPPSMWDMGITIYK
ncbi:hypothetical protein CEQ90_19780 [Lewinellaceae bacterium SD302]|nr:hypothetical protein CEQ90_19780 [Lewinellaceae bacterium SD302]